MRGIRWQAALLGITVVWGATFVVVQDAVEAIPPFRYLTLRFALAAVLMVAAGGLRGFKAGDLVPGTLAGLALVAAYGFQTVGLQYTTASNAGFITGMMVVFTPLFVTAVHRRMPPRAALLGAALAAVGLYFLAAPGRLSLAFGDTLVLGCAAMFAVHILVLDRYGDAMPTFRFATVQIGVCAIGTGVWTLAAEGGAASRLDTSVMTAIAGTAVFGTALAFFVQARAQREIPPTRAAIILTAEPVFAGVFGVLAGERLGLAQLAGAALILTGILVAELRGRAEEVLPDPRTSPA